MASAAHLYNTSELAYNLKVGSGNWIRTNVSGFKAQRPTIRRPRNLGATGRTRTAVGLRRLLTRQVQSPLCHGSVSCTL